MYSFYVIMVFDNSDDLNNKLTSFRTTILKYFIDNVLSVQKYKNRETVLALMFLRQKVNISS